tara:strand:+ start:11172 stop:12146 length:975 start_codon:yes stop_codon:yes gene_type:complete
MTNHSFFHNRRILVTGSTGLLGSWLVEKLIFSGAIVTGISLDHSKDELLVSKGILNDIDNNYLDISDYEKVEKIISTGGFDIVLHLAAQTQVTDAIKNPITTLETNVQGTWNILEACRKFELPLVSASSDKAYGVSENLPYLESHPLNGEFPYEVSKSTSDLISTMYKTTYGVNVASLRCGNIFGGGDFNWDRLIPGIIRYLIEDKTPILRTKGDFIREWVYVEDVADAYLETAKALIEKRNNYSAYNFSSGEVKTVMEIYEMLSLLIKGEIIKPKIKTDSEFEIKDQKLDSSLIKNDLNIKSKYNFKESLTKTITWYKEYFNN